MKINQCIICNNEFESVKSAKYCPECRRKRKVELTINGQQNNIEKLKENQKKYRESETVQQYQKEYQKGYNPQYQEENKNRITEYQKEYREQHKEELRKKKREYYYKKKLEKLKTENLL